MSETSSKRATTRVVDAAKGEYSPGQPQHLYNPVSHVPTMVPRGCTIQTSTKVGAGGMPDAEHLPRSPLAVVSLGAADRGGGEVQSAA